MLTAINFAVNFLCKLSSVGTVDVVDVVDVVKDLCVCSVVGRCRVRSTELLSSSLKTTLTKLNNYYEQVNHLSDSIRTIVIAINMGIVQSATTCCRSIHYRTNKFINVSPILSTN